MIRYRIQKQVQGAAMISDEESALREGALHGCAGIRTPSGEPFLLSRTKPGEPGA